MQRLRVSVEKSKRVFVAHFHLEISRGSKYKQILTKGNKTIVTVGTQSQLFPFVTISDEPTAAFSHLTAVGVSRVPNAGPLEPLLEKHPQLLQAPVAPSTEPTAAPSEVEEG